MARSRSAFRRNQSLGPATPPFSRGTPRVRLRRTLDFTVQDSVWTTIPWLTADLHSGMMWRHDYNSIINQRVTCKTRPGDHSIQCSVRWEAGSAGLRGLRVVHHTQNNALTTVDEDFKTSDLEEITNAISTEYPLLIGEYLTFDVYHEHGAPLDILAVSLNSPIVSVAWKQEIAA
jgi:hypothetical protein